MTDDSTIRSMCSDIYQGGDWEPMIDLIEQKDKEIERLNNIINELEKWLNEKICLNKNDKDYINGMTFVGVNLQMYQMFLDKLQELKGNDK